MRFRFVEDRRADYPVTIMCDVLGVSPAGYYAWRARRESPRAVANRELVDDIKRVHRDTNGRYGSPRVHAELKAQGRGASRGRIERLKRHHGIRAIMARPRRARTTDSRHDFPIAPNLLKRNFIAAAPNRIWLADVTYVETDQGWLYCAPNCHCRSMSPTETIWAQAKLCRQLATREPKNRIYWLAEAERWSGLTQDEISTHCEECNGIQLGDAASRPNVAA